MKPSFCTVILSCDAYKDYWKYFFACAKKYGLYDNNMYLVTETEQCKECETININSPIWTKRFREALSQLETSHLLVMLEDYFIRQPVDNDRISDCFKHMYFGLLDPIVWNFEKNYRDAYHKFCPDGWARQKDRQVYLNSTQPSIWHRERLISRLIKDQTPWEWELTVVNSHYDHYINTSDYIIDVGYEHGKPFGVTQGKLTKECESFFKSEGLLL